MSGDEPKPESADVKLVRDAIEKLGDQFDTVQVFVTRHEAGMHDGTLHIGLGSGNFFARYGQIITWVTANDQEGREVVKKNNRPE